MYLAIQLVDSYSMILKYNMLQLKYKKANYYKNNSTTKIKINRPYLTDHHGNKQVNLKC